MKNLTDNDLDLLAIAYKLTGVEGYAVLKHIVLNREATDDELSRNFKVKPNVIRQILYNLERNNLVIFRKTIDAKTNWVTFYYQMNKSFFSSHSEYKKKSIVGKIDKRYEYEKNHNFFSCPNKCGKIALDEALEQGFRCNKCGEVLTMEDNGKLIKFLENVLSKAIASETRTLPSHQRETRSRRSHKSSIRPHSHKIS